MFPVIFLNSAVIGVSSRLPPASQMTLRLLPELTKGSPAARCRRRRAEGRGCGGGGADGRPKLKEAATG